MVPCIYRSQLHWTYEDDFGRTPCDLELRTYKGDRAPTFQVSNCDDALSFHSTSIKQNLSSVRRLFNSVMTLYHSTQQV